MSDERTHMYERIYEASPDEKRAVIWWDDKAKKVGSSDPQILKSMHTDWYMLAPGINIDETSDYVDYYARKFTNGYIVWKRIA